MQNNTVYENFRTIFTMNLFTVTQDPAIMQDVLRMLDM